MALVNNRTLNYIKKQLPDGYPAYLVVEAFCQATYSYWKDKPVFFAIKHSIVFSARRSFRTALHSLFGWIAATLVQFVETSMLVPTCDVLLYYSAAKPNSQPAMEELASRLAQKGLQCALVRATTMEILSHDDSGQVKRTPVPECSRLFVHGMSRRQNWRTLLSSLYDAFLLSALVLRRDPALFKKVLWNPLNVWYEVLTSAHRLAAANWLLDQIRPQLIITNGEHIPIASEILLSREAGRSVKIWLCNEQPNPDLKPTLFDEVWVWNQYVADEYRRSLASRDAVKFEVIGRAEIDFVLQGSEASEAEEQLRQQVGGNRVVLFLSEFIPDHEVRMGEVTEEALRWIADASRHCPDWRFVYKSRPLHHGERTPGLELIAQTPNCIIPNSDISLRSLLNWDNILVVTAVSSSGLFVAAGVGKLAIRLLVSSQSTPRPIIDRVSIPVNSPVELSELLLDFDRQQIAHHDRTHAYQATLFPYRGHVLDRMESLCRQLLREMEK